jgi:hypothetical protein
VTEEERLTEIDRLVEEQKADDVPICTPESHPGVAYISLNAESNADDHNGGLPLLREDWMAGVEYDFDAMIETGDFDAPGEIMHAFRRPNRGYSLISLPHGTHNGYGNYGCRCARCRAANTAYLVPKMRERRNREQQARDLVECECGCGETFRPIPLGKRFVNYRHADRASKRRQRARMTPEARLNDNARLAGLAKRKVAA